MRRKNRDISVFSTSALDLFASALGAFILIVLVLMPYYKKENPEVEPQPPCEAPPLPVCQACPKPKPKQCPKPKPQVVKRILADSFLILTIEWVQMADIDLYILTPDGWFGQGQYRIPGSSGVYMVDKKTPAPKSVELWKMVDPTPGEYTFCASLFGPFYDGQQATPMPPVAEIRARARLDKPSGPIIVDAITFPKIVRDLKPFPSRMNEMNCFLRVNVSPDLKTTRL